MTMKKVVSASLLLLSMACQEKNETLTPTLTISENDSATLVHFKKMDCPKAYREQDTVLLDRMLGEDFQVIDAYGNWHTKKNELDWIKKNTADNDSFWYEIKRMDIYENGPAIVNGTGHMTNDSVKTTYQVISLLKGMEYGRLSLRMFLE